MELFLSYLRASDQDIGTHLRLALLSGDWISVGLPARLGMVSPDTEIVSLGGATEASIWSIAYPIREVDPAWSRIPYGKPLVNQQFYILNEKGKPCEVGQVGELYIGGAGVALGYCNKPQLTFERFVPDPWSEVGSASMYRTGDFGRFCSDGTIEFLGRIDDQVKVNGHRIELGEIESRLSQWPESAMRGRRGRRISGDSTTGCLRRAEPPTRQSYRDSEGVAETPSCCDGAKRPCHRASTANVGQRQGRSREASGN